MCIFSVIYRAVPDCPVFVLTNRDESTRRPSVAPHPDALDNGTRWFGGSDAQAGGTWFGINEHGLLAAITNRKKDDVPPNPRSRGLLCRDALGHETAKRAADWVQAELGRHQYAGFNLVLVSSTEAYVIEGANSTAATRLDPGVHSVSNGAFQAPTMLAQVGPVACQKHGRRGARLAGLSRACSADLRLSTRAKTRRECVCTARIGGRLVRRLPH